MQGEIRVGHDHFVGELALALRVLEALVERVAEHVLDLVAVHHSHPVAPQVGARLLQHATHTGHTCLQTLRTVYSPLGRVCVGVLTGFVSRPRRCVRPCALLMAEGRTSGHSIPLYCGPIRELHQLGPTTALIDLSMNNSPVC